MNVDAALKASMQLAEGSLPNVSALHNPPMPPEPVVELNAHAGDTVADTALLEMRPTPGEVVALVGVQPTGPAAAPAEPTCDDR